MEYEAEFKITELGGLYYTTAERLSDLKDGFWVNKEGQLTKGSDCIYFILPHMITGITKLT